MTHPHDLALLYDLLDGRIAPAAAEELRKRLTEEPELAAAWDELQRMREGLRALPTPAMPRGFLEGVKSRAGIPAVSGDAMPAAGGGAVGQGAPAGKVFRMRPWAYAAAASVGIVAGLAGYMLASRPQTGDTTVADGTESAKETAGRRKSLPEEFAAGKNEISPRDGESKDDARRAPLTDAPRGAEGAPVVGAPGGAVPPGLRRTEGPAAPPPPATSGPRPQPPAPAPTPPSEPERALAEDEQKRGLGKAQNDGTLAYVREGVDDVLVLHADTLDEARAQVSIFFASVETPPRTAEAWKEPNAAPEFERYAGGPVVMLLRQDATRAKLSGGYAVKPDALAPQSGLVAPGMATSPPTTPAGPSGGAAPAEADKSSPAPTGASRAGAVPPEAQTVLGSFLLELSPAQWARANARIDAASRSRALARATSKIAAPAAKAGEGRKEKGEPTPAKPAAPAAAPVAPVAEPAPAMTEAFPADGKAVTRRVRILVLPTR